MTYKVLIYVLFYMLSTKKLQSIKSLPKMATIVSDVTGLQQTYHQQSIGTSSCWEDQRLSTEGKIVSKYCKCKKTLGRGSVNHPAPPTLVHDWGMNLRVRPRVKWRLGHSNLGYITSYKFIPLKASCWKSIAFFCRMRDFFCVTTCSFNWTSWLSSCVYKIFLQKLFSTCYSAKTITTSP